MGGKAARPSPSTTIAAEVDSESGVMEISVVAVDTADNESEPGTTTLIP